jgi:hypothetical protein
MSYKLNRIEYTDIFFLAQEDVELLGENLIIGSFEEVKSFAETLKQDANDVGEGEFTPIQNPALELSNIIDAKWYLLELPDRYQIVRTDGESAYNLPTNISSNSGYGSLDSIFAKIETLI